MALSLKVGENTQTADLNTSIGPVLLPHDDRYVGACEGSLACSTCHVILDKKSYDELDEPSDEENDMLDLAFGLSETSRLGCQVRLTKSVGGIRARIPSATRNIAVDGYKPPKH